jgi:imidazolonepropionase-like amidohydrolase
VKSPAALHISFGESPVGNWRAKKKIDSRMGLVAMLRQSLIAAQEYKKSFKDYEVKTKQYKDNLSLPEKKRNKYLQEPEPPAKDLGKEVIAMALEQKLPVIASAQRRDDILAAIRLAEEFNLKLIILYGSEAYMIPDELAKRNIPVLLGPITTQPSAMETQGAIYENAALLDKAGVKFAIITGGAHNVRDLRFQAGIAVEYGLAFESALEAITIHPAEILGVGDDIGSIAPGTIANIAIFDGDPLQPLTKVVNVIIEGRQMPLESYQTELYLKYK